MASVMQAKALMEYSLGLKGGNRKSDETEIDK